jgi:hypothetical protein
MDRSGMVLTRIALWMGLAGVLGSFIVTLGLVLFAIGLWEAMH